MMCLTRESQPPFFRQRAFGRQTDVQIPPLVRHPSPHFFISAHTFAPYLYNHLLGIETQTTDLLY
jgi:hypothetical protein